MTIFCIEQQDALQLLAGIPDNSIDLIVTDPPYESLEKHRAKGTTTRLGGAKRNKLIDCPACDGGREVIGGGCSVCDGGKVEAHAVGVLDAPTAEDEQETPQETPQKPPNWFPVVSNQYLGAVLAELLRVLKPGRHCYIFCDPETSYALVPAALAMGWQWGNRLIWDKVQIGMGYHYRRRYEDVLFLWKKAAANHPKRKLANLGTADVLTVPRVRGGYPTEKPVDLIRILVRQSARRGETVLDPFCGSGSTGVAALQENCDFFGGDVTQAAVELAVQNCAGPGAVEVGDRGERRALQRILDLLVEDE